MQSSPTNCRASVRNILAFAFIAASPCLPEEPSCVLAITLVSQADIRQTAQILALAAIRTNLSKETDSLRIVALRSLRLVAAKRLRPREIPIQLPPAPRPATL